MRRTLLVSILALGALATVPAVGSATSEPYTFTPEPGNAYEVPPVGYLEGPCGIAVDFEGNFYIADYGHHAIDVFGPSLDYGEQIKEAPTHSGASSTDNGPCGLAADSLGRLYVNELHRAVLRLNTELDPGPATGVAAEAAGGNVFVDDRTHISAYGPTGAPIEVAGQPLQIGEGSLEKGYGAAISAYPGTKGFLYVADAGSNTVKVYDPATDIENPVEEIAPGFISLRDSALAVDDETGEIYVVDDLQPNVTESPEAVVQVFEADGHYEGRLKYNVFNARPVGLAVDNSGSSSQGRVYVTSGTTEYASVLIYQPGSAGSETYSAPPIREPLPPAQGSGAPLPEPPPPVTCEGDSCQQLPADPTDPTLTTLLEGSVDPPVRYFNTNRLPHYATFRGHHRRRAHRKGKRSSADSGEAPL